MNVVVAVAGVGVAILAGAYIVWGSDQLFRRKARCPGLINLGNTCFLNAVLQAVKLWIFGSVDKYDGPMTKALNQVLTARHRWKLTFEQQDAHELYHVLLSTLEDEMAPSSSTLLNVEMLNNPRDGAVWTRTVGPLRGTIRGLLQCCVCKENLPTRCEHFHSLSLTLPVNEKKQFVQSEIVDNVDCLACSKIAGTPVKRTFLKQLQLWAIPNCLCIHINRTVWQSTDGLNKNTVHMSFPLKLDMGRYTGGHDATRSVRLYSLQSVIEHMGGPSSGHYATYRKVVERRTSQWVHLSDTAVYNVDVKDVARCTAFLTGCTYGHFTVVHGVSSVFKVSSSSCPYMVTEVHVNLAYGFW
ncbi:hypothetical protein EMCRGX_G023857 [Ephydatia muelleri]